MIYNKYIHWCLACGLLLLAFLVANTNFIAALIAYMLFVPLIDANWSQLKVSLSYRPYSVYVWLACVFVIAILITLNTQVLLFTLTTLAVAALPEEWFFRAYLQNKLGNTLRAVIISSAVFSCAHMITVSWLAGFLVFIPSVIYGFIYRKTGDLVLVVLLHVLSNVLYNVYLHKLVDQILLFMNI